MTSINDVFSSGTSLKASDLKGKPATIVTITGFKIQEFEETKNGQPFKKKKIVLSFRGTEKTLVCNVTNSKIIGELIGPKIEDWIGQKILLKADRTSYSGQLVDCIRVGDPNDKIQSGPPVKQVLAQVDEDMNDEIPF